MSDIFIIFLFFLSSLFAYLFSLSPFTNYTPQLIAFLAIILILFRQRKSWIIYELALIINIIVFTTNGLSSPVFFLVYFLLFTIAFLNSPTVTLSYSLVLVVLFSQSLNSFNSILPLSALLFITPLAWFIGKRCLSLNRSIAHNETEIFLWVSLKFKTGITTIIDSASQLLSQPQLSHTQKEQLKYIKDSAKSLLNSSVKLTENIENDNQKDEV